MAEFLSNLFVADTVAHAVLILSLVIVFGLALGNVKIFEINLGIAGVLFAGIIFGHFHFSIDPSVMEFVREFGLILFVYTVGMQVGPGFFSSLKREGLRFNLLAATVVILGIVLTLLIHYFAKIPAATAVGMFSGATTNTPSLAASLQAMKDTLGTSSELLKLPAIGYAVCYPFGVIGTILAMIVVKKFFGINPEKEAKNFLRTQEENASPLKVMNLEVSNTNLAGLAIQKIPGLAGSGVVISRIMQNNVLNIAQPQTILQIGNILLAVGPQEKLEELRIVIGKESAVDLRKIDSPITNQRILVTRKAVLGKTIAELNLRARYNVTVTRVIRTEVEFAASSDIVLQFGDILLVVGDNEAIAQAALELGNSPKELDHPQIIPIFAGIILGVIVGNWPIHLPGANVPVKLGLAGGPLLVAIVLSFIGRLGPLVWYMPRSTNLMFREVGISLFLACVGLKAGSGFFQTLSQGQGLYWMLWGAVITFVPITVVAIFARNKFKLSYMSICGLLAGSMTDPPALAFANAAVSSSAVSMSYATVYPLVMILRIIGAQVLVLFLLQ